MAAWADSAAVATMSTRVESVAEATRTLASRLDSMIAAGRDTIQDTTWVGLIDRHLENVPNWHGLTPWMGVGWLVTLIGISIAAGVSIAGWRRSAESAKKVQDDSLRAQLITRIRSSLEMGVRRLTSVLNLDNTTPISADAMKLLQLSWERYDRVSDNLGLLKNERLEAEIDEVLIALKATAEKILAEEQQFRRTRRELGKKTDRAIISHPDTEQGIREHRKKLLDMIAKITARAEERLRRFNEVFPPPDWHEEQDVADVTPTAPPPARGTESP